MYQALYMHHLIYFLKKQKEHLGDGAYESHSQLEILNFQ